MCYDTLIISYFAESVKPKKYTNAQSPYQPTICGLKNINWEEINCIKLEHHVREIELGSFFINDWSLPVLFFPDKLFLVPLLFHHLLILPA